MFAMVAASAACMSGAPRVASVQNKCALHTAVARDAPCGVATKAHKALVCHSLNFSIVTSMLFACAPKYASFGPCVYYPHQATSALPMAAANAVALKDVAKLPSVAEGAQPTVAGVDALSLGAVNMHKAARSAV